MTTTGGTQTPMTNDHCMQFTLTPTASRLKAVDGREVDFTKAMLSIRSTCSTELLNMVPHVTLGQEGGTVQDVTHALANSTPGSLPAGGFATWDVFDILLPAHSGTASKLHMFGYRAALNWRFDLAAWAEYRTAADSVVVSTPVQKWALRWTVPDAATGAIELVIDDTAA